MTTSSCGGRIAVFLEGRKGGDGNGQEGEDREDREEGTRAGVGGKGGGGRWLFVTHEPVDIGIGDDAMNLTELFGMSKTESSSSEEEEDVMRGRKVSDVRFVHFKFEPMVCMFFYHLFEANHLKGEKKKDTQVKD